MKKLLTVALGLFIAFSLLEVGLRIYHHGASPGERFDTSSPIRKSRYVSHPFLPYSGRPSSRFELYNGPERTPEIIVTNAFGFRAHEFPVEKAPNDFFVLAFGGSTTYGYKAESNAATWPELLERKLADRYPNRRIRVFNMGVDMATTAFSVVNLSLIGVHVRPDLVIVYQGYNDLAALGYSTFRSDHSHFYKDIDPMEASRGIQLGMPRALLRSYAIYYATGALDTYFGVNDLMQTARRPNESPDPDRLRGIETTLANLRTIEAIARGRGAQALFSTFQFTYESRQPEYQRFNEALRTFFRANGMNWVDQSALIPDEDPTINVDDCHFTPKGRGLVVQNFYEWIVANDLIR